MFVPAWGYVDSYMNRSLSRFTLLLLTLFLLATRAALGNPPETTEILPLEQVHPGMQGYA
jgi:hypothetical protein